MKRKNIVILVITVIIFIVLLLPDKQASAEEKSFPKIMERVSKVEIIHNQEKVTFFFDEDNWKIAGKINHPLRKDMINSILEFIQKDITGELVSTAKVYDKYGLDEENSYQFTFYQNENKVGFFTIGNNGNKRDSFYFIWQDDATIYQVVGNRFAFTRDFQDFIDTTIFKEEKDKVVSLTITKDNKMLVLTKNNNSATSSQDEKKSEEKKAVEWLDQNNNLYELNEINDIINTVVSLEAEAFLDDKKKNDLNEMDYQFSLVLNDNKEIKLVVFEENNQFLAVSSQNDNIFSLKEEDSNRLTVNDFDELKKK